MESKDGTVGGSVESGTARPCTAPLFKGLKPVPQTERTLPPPPTKPPSLLAGKNAFSPMRGKDATLTAEQAIAVGQKMGNGNTLQKALTLNLISMGCWKANVTRYAVIKDAFEMAYAKTVDQHIQNVANRVTNWQASAWILERTQRDQFGKLGPASPVTIHNTQVSGTLSTEEARDLSSRARQQFCRASRN